MSLPRPADAGFLPAIGIKIVLLGLLDALALWAALFLLQGRAWGLLFPLGAGTLLINAAFLSQKAYPLRYLLPGVFCVAAMVVYPLGYTVYVAFTNYGAGHILSQEQAIAQIEGRLYVPPDAPRYAYELYRNAAGELKILLTGSDGTLLLSEGTWPALSLAPVPPEDPRLTDTDGDGVFDRVDGYERLNRLQLVQSLDRLQGMRLAYGEEQLRIADLSSFQAARRQYRYDPASGVLTNLVTRTDYRPVAGFFTEPGGERLLPGFRTLVGWENFKQLFTNPRIAAPFARVFTWTLVWAFASVATTFCLGLGLAILLNDPYLRLRRLYRTLLIVPYAMPAFISALIWRGFFNDEVGIINGALRSLFGIAVPWLQDPLWAKIALILVNLWLGFPYMLIVCLGALQSLPGELYEAARVDGATWREQFRQITLPLLLVSVAPLLVASFAYNFNNFVVIYLVTQGRPPLPGAETPAGATDILISYTFRLAFESGSGGDYGLASAVALLIFMIVGAITWFNFRLTRGVEKVGENV